MTPRYDRLGLAHLAVVYVVWGSTYLAIRLCVREGAGFPPFTLAFMRVVVAGVILMIWAKLKGSRMKPTPSEAVVLAGTGVLLWVGGNGLVTWAEQKTDSGLTALLVAALAIWGAVLEAIIDRRRPSLKLTVSLVIGFMGVGFLTWPTIRHGATGELWSIIALLAAPFWWALGSVWLTRRRPDLSVQVISGWQHLFGGLGFLIVILVLDEPLPTPTTQAWLSWVYLTLFGSVLAFTSYITVLKLLPIQLGMTYSYANPVIAVFLGWLILSEPVTGWTVAGTALVLAGIAGVFNNKPARG